MLKPILTFTAMMLSLVCVLVPNVVAAGIKPASIGISPIPEHYLQVWVGIVGTAFQIRVEFHRRARWSLPDGTTVKERPIAWNEGTFGTHGRDVNYILNALDQELEAFLNAYLKVNQS